MLLTLIRLILIIQTALSILTAASKAIAYEEDTVNIDLMIDAAIRYLQDTNTMLKEM